MCYRKLHHILHSKETDLSPRTHSTKSCWRHACVIFGLQGFTVFFLSFLLLEECTYHWQRNCRQIHSRKAQFRTTKETNFSRIKISGCNFFAYNLKLPAYGGAFSLTVVFGSFFPYGWSSFLTIGAFLLTIGAFLLSRGAFLLSRGNCL